MGARQGAEASGTAVRWMKKENSVSAAGENSGPGIRPGPRRVNAVGPGPSQGLQGPRSAGSSEISAAKSL